MNFNLVEKLALLKAIDEVIQMDNEVKPGELDYMEQLAVALDFDADLLEEARIVEPAEALAVLGAMPSEKQQALIRLMTEAANSDGQVDEKEIRFIYRVFSAAGIEPDI